MPRYSLIVGTATFTEPSFSGVSLLSKKPLSMYARGSKSFVLNYGQPLLPEGIVLILFRPCPPSKTQYWHNLTL